MGEPAAETAVHAALHMPCLFAMILGTEQLVIVAPEPILSTFNIPRLISAVFHHQSWPTNETK